MVILGKIRFLLFSISKLKRIIHGYIGYRSKIRVDKKSRIYLGNHFGLSSDSIVNVTEGGIFSVGENFGANKNCYISCKEKITIGNNVIIGPNFVMVDNNHDFSHTNFRNSYKCRPISIGNNVWIGANVVILPGTQIADGVIVGAGTVLRGVIDKDTIVFSKSELVRKSILKEEEQ